MWNLSFTGVAFVKGNSCDVFHCAADNKKENPRLDDRITHAGEHVFVQVPNQCVHAMAQYHIVTELAAKSPCGAWRPATAERRGFSLHEHRCSNSQ